jgi:D-alanyl-D-alanine carboxypeptidase (penicillin-binding protein 5/6)
MDTELPLNNTETENQLVNPSEPESLAVEETSIPVVGQLVLLSALMLLIFGSTLTPKVLTFFEKGTGSVAQVVSEQVIENTDTPGSVPTFEDLSLTADAAYVFDVHTQKALYKKNESQQLPLASITKLMTALVAQELLSEQDTISIDELSLRQDGSSGLALGEVWSRLSLSDMVLMASSNDGAYALAAAAGDALQTGRDGASAFVDAMNIRAKEIGLHQTYFKNPTGLDLSPNEGGAYGTARDVAFLMEYIVKNEPDILSYTKEHAARFYSEGGTYHDAENTNDYISTIPGLIGSKTGYTDLAGGNLVVAFNAGLDRPVIAVVLGSTQEARFSDIKKLVEASQRALMTTQ